MLLWTTTTGQNGLFRIFGFHFSFNYFQLFQWNMWYFIHFQFAQIGSYVSWCERLWKTLKYTWSFKYSGVGKGKKPNKQQRTDYTSILGKCVWKVPVLKDRVCKGKKKNQTTYPSVAIFFCSIIQALRICLTVSFLFWGHHFSLCWKRTSLVIFIRGHSVRIYFPPAMQRSISLSFSMPGIAVNTYFYLQNIFLLALQKDIS